MFALGTTPTLRGESNVPSKLKVYGKGWTWLPAWLSIQPRGTNAMRWSISLPRFGSIVLN
jgi:hypothetical protein